MNNEVLFSTKSDEWSTPQALFDKLNDFFHFNLDPCATDENHKCEKYYTIETDGLSQNWEGHVSFVNPPYSQCKEWIKKCSEEGRKPNTAVVCLVPSRTDVRWFHDYCVNKSSIIFLKGRLKFGDSKNSAPFPSMICIFDNISVYCHGCG